MPINAQTIPPVQLRTTNVFKKIAKAVNGGARTVIEQGGTSCFGPQQRVITERGSIPISQIRRGDMVRSFNLKTGLEEFRPVKNVFKFKNQKHTVKVRLKNGQEIIATEDHKFFTKGGCGSLKHILSCCHGNLDVNTRVQEI